MFILINLVSRLAGSNACRGLAMAEGAVWTTLFVLAFTFVMLGPLWALAAPVAVVVIAEAAVRVRRRRAGVILSHLDQAVRMNLPLPPMLFAASDAERGVTSRRLHDLAMQLDEGAALADAVRDAVPEIDARANRMLSVGEWTGRPEPVLGYLVDRYAPVIDEQDSRRFEWLYIVVVLMMMSMILFGLVVMVIPKFNAIFNDFGTEMPAATQSLVDAVDFLVRRTPLAGIFGLILLLAMTLGAVVMLERWWVGRVDWGAPLRWFGSAVGSRIPGVRTFIRDRAMAQVCFVLSEATRSGLRLDSAIEEAAHLEMPSLWRGRLARFADLLRHGAEPGDAASASDMPDIVCGMIGPAARTGDLAGAFDFLARYFEHRFSRAAALLRGAMLPAMVLSLGFLVGFIVYALFLPLTRLIEGTIGQTGS